MEADEVFSTLSDKISALDSKLGDLAGRVDGLQSAVGDARLSDLKSALDRAQSDIQQIKDTLASLKSGTDTQQQAAAQQGQSLLDKMKAIEDANAASEKRYQDQQGLLGKLAAQADDATKTLMNIGDTTNAIVKKAWDDGKKEILDIWDSSKADLLNSLSSVTTKAIQDAKAGIKGEITDELKSLVFDDVKAAQPDVKPPLSDADLEAKIRAIVKEMQAPT